MVAPIRVITPDSTWGSSASCCARLKRWISSRKSTVRSPPRRARSASAITSRTSLTPALTAESPTKRAARPPGAAFATSRARVVLPQPGGPQSSSEGSVPAPISARSGAPGATRCDCPAISSSVRGRMRSASGAEAPGPEGEPDAREAGGAESANKSSVSSARVIAPGYSRRNTPGRSTTKLEPSPATRAWLNLRIFVVERPWVVRGVRRGTSLVEPGQRLRRARGAATLGGDVVAAHTGSPRWVVREAALRGRALGGARAGAVARGARRRGVIR